MQTIKLRQTTENTGGGWGETLHVIVKRFGCTAIHIKALYKCPFIHSFIH